MASLTFRQVHKRFSRRVHALKGIDLHIEDGSFVCLVGPSGCGKSTLLNLIAGLESISEGELFFDDELVNSLPPGERDVAMVFQNYALYPHKTAYENLAFPLRIAKLPKEEIDARVREAAKVLEIEELLQRKPGAMSGGQRQRVALGRALVRRPRMFLFDEPLSNLDAALRVHMRAEIKRLHARLGRTFVYVTHDQAEAMTLSDVVVVLKNGEIQQVGAPRELYERPNNTFVAGFLGSPSISLIRGRVEGGAFHCDAGKVALSPQWQQSLSGVEGELLLGVRAEDARVEWLESQGGKAAVGISSEGKAVLGSSSPSAEGALEGQVAMVESMGAESFVSVDLPGNARVICRAAPDFSAELGQEMWVQLDIERLHFFDAKSGARL